MHDARRVLVTGGAGFIGRHIVAELASTSRVVVLDDLSTGNEAAIPPTVDLVEEDIAADAVVRRIVLLAPDIIIHAAAQASVTASERDPARDHAVNVEGTRHVAQAASRLGGRQVVFLSSGGALYGETPRRANERIRPRPISAYGEHKWQAERVLAASRVPFRIVRLANVYGPGQRGDLEAGVIAIFLERLRNRQPLTIYGSGDQMRDFVEVRDVASAIGRLTTWPRDGVWNIATGRSTTINDLARLLEGALRVRAAVEYLPARPNEIIRSLISPARMARETGWRATTSLRAGLTSLARPSAARVAQTSTAPQR